MDLCVQIHGFHFNCFKWFRAVCVNPEYQIGSEWPILGKCVFIKHQKLMSSSFWELIDARIDARLRKLRPLCTHSTILLCCKCERQKTVKRPSTDLDNSSDNLMWSCEKEQQQQQQSLRIMGTFHFGAMCVHKRDQIPPPTSGDVIVRNYLRLLPTQLSRPITLGHYTSWSTDCAGDFM